MWKWIVGGLLVVVVALFATCYIGYKKLTSGGDAAIVAVDAPAERIWASLANPDSMPSWMSPGTTVTSSRHGILVAGDTVHLESSTRARSQNFTWIVTEVTPGRLLVLQMRSDSTGQVLASRRDSIATDGDSTRVVSTIGSPMIDSIRTKRGDTGGKFGGAVLDLSSKLLVSAFRVQSEQDLQRLKVRLEAHRKP